MKPNESFKFGGVHNVDSFVESFKISQPLTPLLDFLSLMTNEGILLSPFDFAPPN